MIIVVKNNRFLDQSRVSWPVRDSGPTGRVRRATRKSKRCNSAGTTDQHHRSFQKAQDWRAVQQRITRQQRHQIHHGPQSQPQAQSKRCGITQGRGQRKQTPKDQTGECAPCYASKYWCRGQSGWICSGELLHFPSKAPSLACCPPATTDCDTRQARSNAWTLQDHQD